jgi:hypothetical protein
MSGRKNNIFYLLLEWTIGDHICIGLVERIPFDYSYAPFRVRVKKLRLLEDAGRKKRHTNSNSCYSARGEQYPFVPASPLP